MKTNRKSASNEMAAAMTTLAKKCADELEKCSSAYIEFKDEIQISRVDVIDILEEITRLLAQITQPQAGVQAVVMGPIRHRLDHLKRRTEKWTRE